MFEAAELAATIAEPKELTADWINTFEMENNRLCKPAGRPILTIRLSFSKSMRIFRGMNRMAPSLRIR